VTAGHPSDVRRADALLGRIRRLETELDALLASDRAGPSLIPPAREAPRKARAPKRGADATGRGSEIGLCIRDARRALGMTQLELADATGIRRPNVARLERGRNTPTIDTLQRVATALGVTVSDLVPGA
jgi:DNA-binding XRE family transcriptional regulator